MKKLMILFVLGLLRLNCGVMAQGVTGDVVPLKVGSVLPEKFWEQGLSVYAGGKVSVKQLSFYKDRLLVLDFWGRYCAPCIRSMPKMDSLNKAFEGRLTVLPVGDCKSAVDLKGVLTRYGLMGLGMEQGLYSPYLALTFPFGILPHLVWIYQGRVVAITDGEYLDKENVVAMLSLDAEGAIKLLPTKVDKAVRGEVELIGFGDLRLEKPKGFFYSAFTGYLEGASPPEGRIVDSALATTRLRLFNKPLLAYCRLAYDFKSISDTSMFELQVASKDRYFQRTRYYEPWARDNTYCYTVNLPMEMGKEERSEFIRQDIRRWLLLMGISLSFEKRKAADGSEKIKIVVSERGLHG
ncbi:hypothetical protein GM921_09930 [Pedobacter sp. LMG 31464]|uniref:Thioredoxin domain-containing protein n=1 Tax=Pedobacter planticolens TaxID=2679964 RepID=A0A923DXE9_9SPHI|nr:hypothetical protein [Pedobacter planticolens]MBB2145806.1 hypothetical protein [Pedobacter planticolens]